MKNSKKNQKKWLNSTIWNLIKQFTTDADKETIKKDIAVQKAAKLVVDAAK